MGKQPDSARPRRRLWGVIAVLAMAASIVFIAPASAQEEEDSPPGVELVNVRPDGTQVYRGPGGYAYDNTTGEQLDFVVVHGGDMIDVCGLRPDNEGGLPPISRFLVRETDGGKFVIKTPPAGVMTYTSVYKTDLPVIPDFFDAVCGGFFENGTPIPAPFAVGMTTLHRVERVADLRGAIDITTPQPRGIFRNGVEGVVADADGTLYDLTTVARFTKRTAEGMPNFREATVTLTPKAG